MSVLDERFCCLVTLHTVHNRSTNLSAVCSMRLGPRPSLCFIPLTITNTASLPHIVSLSATVHRVTTDRCTSSTHYPPSSAIYAISAPLFLSLSHRPPFIWHLAELTHTHLLLGLPLHSSRSGDNILIAIRLISDLASVSSQIMSFQCVLDERINIIGLLPNYPLVSILNNFSFSNSTHSFHNIKIQMTPGKDRELFYLNASLSGGDSSVSSTEYPSPALQCCIKRTSGIKQRTFDCGRAKIVILPLEINSMIIIPALKTVTGNMFSIYLTPNVTLSIDSIKVYAILNYRDRSLSEVSQQVEISVIDQTRVKMIGKSTNNLSLDIKYQTYINPWSLQLSIYDYKYTVLSPVKIWRADSWRIVLSDDILRPIKDWMVPGSTSNNRKICVSRFKVSRLKILCRLYLLDESGQRHYIGAESSQNSDPPFVDITYLTLSSQLQITPANVLSVERSTDNTHFLLSAKQIRQSSSIELLSPETLQVIAATSISVESDLDSLYVTDIIVHCVDAILLRQKNKKVDSITSSAEYDSITVSMSMDSQTLPCYLLVFLVFSDRSMERVSSFDHNHYRLFLVTFDSRPLSSTVITDGQFVTVQWTKNVNISLFESSTCREPKLIFSKRINWDENVPLKKTNLPTDIPINQRVHIITNTTDKYIVNHTQESSTSILHTSLYILTALLAFCFLCLVMHKIFCSKSRSNNQSSVPTCYNISDPGFISDQNKILVRNTNSKTFSSLGKCSSNCMRQNHSKCHSNEPYPPLLPPPGPIAANYDLTINDPVCCGSAVDSGIELGKLSSYSSNTNQSNDICCGLEPQMSSSTMEDNLYRQNPQFSNPLFGYYPHKDMMESITKYHDNTGTKTISNLRPSQW